MVGDNNLSKMCQKCGQVHPDLVWTQGSRNPLRAFESPKCAPDPWLQHDVSTSNIEVQSQSLLPAPRLQVPQDCQNCADQGCIYTSLAPMRSCLVSKGASDQWLQYTLSNLSLGARMQSQRSASCAFRRHLCFVGVRPHFWDRVQLRKFGVQPSFWSNLRKTHKVNGLPH